MKRLYPKKPIIEILNTETNKKDPTKKNLILFTPLTEDEFRYLDAAMIRYATFPKGSQKKKELDDLLYKEHSFTFDRIIAAGDTTMDTRQANSLIEHATTKINDIVKNTYKCFVNLNWQIPSKYNIIFHEDGGCSWNCLMLKLKNPTHGVIFSIPIESRSKFKL